MAFLIKDTVDVIRSDLMKTAYFNSVDMGEPKSPPVTDTKFSFHIWMDSTAVVATTPRLRERKRFLRHWRSGFKEGRGAGMLFSQKGGPPRSSNRMTPRFKPYSSAKTEWEARAK